MKFYAPLALLILLMIGAIMAPPSWAASSLPQPTLEAGAAWRTVPLLAPVTALAAAGETLWVGTTQGLIRYNRPDGTMVTYTTADGLIDNSISTLAIDPEGQLWVGTWGGGVAVLNGEQWTTHHTTGRATLTHTGDNLTWLISELPTAEFYLPQQATLKKKGQAGLKPLNLTEIWTVLSELGSNFTDLAAAPTGSIWAVNANQLLQIEPVGWWAFDLPAELRETIAANPSWALATVTDLAGTADGTVWLNTREVGLYRFAEGVWQQFSQTDGLPADTVLRLTVDTKDRLRAIFSAEDKYSLAYFEGQAWQSQRSPEDLTGAPTGLAVMPAGEVWLAASGQAPYRFDGQQWQKEVESWTSGSFDMFLATGPAGTIWFGSDNGWQRWSGQGWPQGQVTIPAPFLFRLLWMLMAARGVLSPRFVIGAGCPISMKTARSMSRQSNRAASPLPMAWATPRWTHRRTPLTPILPAPMPCRILSWPPTGGSGLLPRVN